MMKYTVSSVFLLLVAGLSFLKGQTGLRGIVLDAETEAPLAKIEVYLFPIDAQTLSDEDGTFRFANLVAGDYELVVFSPQHQLYRQKIHYEGDSLRLSVRLKATEYELSEVLISAKREELFALRRLREVEGTSIYAGKKNEVVVMDLLTVNLAANNPREIYRQVAGLNIYETSDAGLQLNIGGRGLDPNRSANFNTRQNGYDISADVLGYPESYYTPPAEALAEIQVIRGAASLQYGTQFGGLVNFRFKQPVEDKKISWTSRQSIGSFGLFTSFNRLSGTVGSLQYAAYFHHKQGNGFRPNSGFASQNAFVDLHYHLSEKTELELEFTYLSYLAQQAGGLTDAQFYRDPWQSNRTRNWFEVDWHLLTLRLEHTFSARTQWTTQLTGLDASRNALGFRTNRVSQTDDLSAPRDLIKGTFQNLGLESRLLHRYQIGSKRAVALIGTKIYQADNIAIQGAGTNGVDADFRLANEDFPFYPNQSDFRFPNFNFALFGEHIFYLSDRLSLTPGIRFEHIRTESEGTYKKIDFDLAGNPIRDTTFADNRVFERAFVLAGLGLSFKANKDQELYANISQNYRSVTFSDIRVINPAFQLDPDITDESGFTADIGYRGRWKEFLSFDIGWYGLLYDNRLGEVLQAETRETATGELIQTGRIIRFRTNIGRAFMTGIESLIDWNLRKTFLPSHPQLKLGLFVNTALTASRYLQSDVAGVEGKEVEFVPLVNTKSGLNFGYRNLVGSLQFTYLSQQYTDATNAPQNAQDNQSGIRGAIPAYSVMDFSLAYRYKALKLETGMNNILNQAYFTQRATGYPGPGIIPSAPRSFYLAVQLQL
ncbi:MAG: TonB-dependent receptor [Bacteroidota bacterium]